MTGTKTGRRGLRAARPYLYILPMLIFALVFCYYPAIKTLLYSFSLVNIQGEIVGFAGLENYQYLFSRRDFGIALTNTLKLVAINTPVTLIITLLFAVLCARKKPGIGVAEWLFSLPMAVSMSAAALIFQVLLNPSTGFINAVLGLDIGWLEDKNTAMWAILLITIWMGIGFNFLLLLSALRSIPSGVLDAAALDGCKPLRLFFQVQLPHILPTVFYVLCSNLVLAILTSGPIIMLTDGGPARSTTTLVFMLYSSGYGSSNYSLAACVSVVAFLLSFTFAFGAFVLDGKRGRDK